MAHIPDPLARVDQAGPDICPDDHVPVAGMMYVDMEDLDTVARQRAKTSSHPIECEDCPAQYLVGKGWVI